LAQFDDAIIIALDNPQFHLKTVSQTFHGRDIFAPVAAHLATGTPLDALGTPLARIAQMMQPTLRLDGKRLSGQVLYNDHFGNIITSIAHLRWLSAQQLRLEPRFGRQQMPLELAAQAVNIQIAGKKISGIQPTYSTAARHHLLALVDSNGYLEIACNQGHAAQLLGIRGDEPVTLEIG
jgi:S-adenosyl-L-methionine hydrolase (adenosine-forming)